MTVSNRSLARMADILVFAFPVLILCVPRGAGVFIAGVCTLLLLRARHLGQAWREHTQVLVPLIVSVVAFLAVFLASKIYHETPWNVLDNPSRMLLAVFCCWMVVHAAPNPGRLWTGITVGLLGALLIVCYQFVVMQDARPAAWVQPIAFANMVAALALVGFARPGNDARSHLLAWLNIFCAVPILILNGTRGGMVAMALTLFPLLLVRSRHFSTRMLLATCAGIVVLAGAAYSFPGSPLPERMERAITEVRQFEQGNSESSVGARLQMWEIGMRYFADHPVSGVGVGQFSKILHAAPYCEHRTESMVCILEHAHNDIVETAATTGLPGLLVFLGVFLVPALSFWRMMRSCHIARNRRGESLASAGLAVILASLISGLTQVTLAHQANVVFYAGITGLLLGLAARETAAIRGCDAKTTKSRDSSVSMAGST